jgi:hypothetical protein
MKGCRTLLLTWAIVACASASYTASDNKAEAAQYFGKRSDAYKTVAKDLYDIGSASAGADQDVAHQLSDIAGHWHDRLDYLAELFELASEMKCQADEPLVLARIGERAKYLSLVLDEDVRYVNELTALIEKPGLAQQARVLRDGLHGTRRALVGASK